jgi:two-component system chemotaxis response regulator CheY
MADPNLKILIVDDFATVRKIVRNLLKQLNFNKVDEADDDSTALAKLKAEEFDFVITDWHMPQMTGWQVAEKVKV